MAELDEARAQLSGPAEYVRNSVVLAPQPLGALPRLGTSQGLGPVAALGTLAEKSAPLTAPDRLVASGDGPACLTAAPEAAPCPDGRLARRSPWREWLQTFVTTMAIFVLVETFVVQGYKVYGGCMEPNLRTGERLLGSKLAYQVSDIQRGDIVVFCPPHHVDTSFIKRVIGLPGEVVAIRNDRVFIDGQLLEEPYLRRDWRDDLPPTRVRSRMVFVLGDNRDNSSDSRIWGELPIANIQAKAWLRYWPPSRIEILR